MRRKIFTPLALAEVINRLKKKGKRIVFTNGTFDLLHLGHVTYLQKAREFGDVLIVAVNSDKSVKSYKTPDRPLNPQDDRMKVLSALECVDYVVLFQDPTPIKLITLLRPDVLVKGADWKKSQIAGAAEVESWGGAVKLIKLVPNRSTTRLINLMKAPVHA